MRIEFPLFHFCCLLILLATGATLLAFAMNAG